VGTSLERRHGRRGGGNHAALLLAAHLEDLAVGVGVDAAHERGAARRAVLGEEPARLVADAARVAQRLGALGARTPLRGLLHATVAAAPVAGPGLRRGRGRGRVGREVLRLPPPLLGPVLATLATVLGLLRRRPRQEVAVTEKALAELQPAERGRV
jgi:hypothetical protein